MKTFIISLLVTFVVTMAVFLTASTMLHEDPEFAAEQAELTRYCENKVARELGRRVDREDALYRNEVLRCTIAANSREAQRNLGETWSKIRGR